MVKFRGVEIADKKVIIYGKGEGGGVGVVAEKHEGGSFVVAVQCWVRSETRWSWDKSPDWEGQGLFSGHHRR